MFFHNKLNHLLPPTPPKSHELNWIVLKKIVLSKFQSSFLTQCWLLSICPLPPYLPAICSPTSCVPWEADPWTASPTPWSAGFASWAWLMDTGDKRQEGEGLGYLGDCSFFVSPQPSCHIPPLPGSPVPPAPTLTGLPHTLFFLALGVEKPSYCCSSLKL